jgi:hypothetical protein
VRTVILVPRRDGQVDRDLVWAWVRQWWRDHFPEMELFEGHHDEGLFNRSAAVNRAAGGADWEAPAPWDVAVIIDSDVICNPDRVRQAVELAAETGRMVLPFDHRKDLKPAGNQSVMAGYTGSWERFVRHVYSDMCSSVVVVRRSLWDDVGGFDETFAGWGFEDNAFAAACETFAGAPLVKIPGDLWHFWHPTAAEGKRGTATHERNKARADRYLAVRGDRDATRALRATAAPSFEHRPSGIPKILHRVVPERTTAEVERWWAEFAAMHPDWELRTHRDPLNPADWPETSHKWADVENGAQLADLIRLEALWRWGGIYVDSDVEPWRPLDSLLPLSAFAAWEDERTVPNAVMGAVPSHPAIRECLDLMLARIPGPTWEAGPGVTTSILPGRSDVLLLPAESFYPVWYRDPERDRKMNDPKRRQRHPASFALHRYHGSWLAGRASS